MGVGGSEVDEHSLELLEFPHVTATIAGRAECDGARAALAARRPLILRADRARENARLAEAIRRVREPGEWCMVGRGELAPALERAGSSSLDGDALLVVLSWLEAARSTREAWPGAEQGARFARLSALVNEVVTPAELLKRLSAALEPDGRLRDGASPALKRLRRDLSEGERRLEGRLERWARGFGSESYVTRHGDRFVALVPAAGFPRRRAIVHDVSGSGQSLFVEPIEICEDNNRLLELRAAVAEEERRILRELSAAVAASHDALVVLERALIELDTLRARARWAVEFGAVAINPEGSRLRLSAARHPLLAMAARPERPIVPLDLELGGEGPGRGSRLLLVSGPNMGGKTVLLKTVGLAVALAHAGLPVIAGEGDVIPEVETIVVDLGDEQSVEQGLSTFAAHLQVLTRMAALAGPATLVLCDELGAGTDPVEGAALGRALVEHFAACHTWGVVTTHLGSLKNLAGEIDGVVNGSLEFDLETLSPRYRFLSGVPGASHALSVAERLGFPASLLQRARSLTPDSARAVERLTAELSVAVRQAREEAEVLARARHDAEMAAAHHREAVEEGRRELAEKRRALTRESEVLLARARELWQTIQREARRGDKTRADAERLRSELSGIERAAEVLAAPARQSVASGAPMGADAATPGRRVRVTDLNLEAEIVSGPDAEGRVTLRRGNWSIQSRLDRLAPVEGGAPEPVRAVAGTWQTPEEAPPLELDVRGMEVDEALAALDSGLDRAVMAGLSELRVIHGIGRGVLRAAVEKHLRSHPQVASERLGAVGEGGRGVTVARLK